MGKIHMRTIKISRKVPAKSCEGCLFIRYAMGGYCFMFLTEKGFKIIHNHKPCRQCREATVKGKE